MPSISVVVTCHNYGHFLETCLASLRVQSRPADQIIVVDDGSTDASGAILRDQAGVTVLEQPNRGQASAFNAGFARVTSDLVLFLDADDTLAPDALEMLASAWHPSLSALAFGLGFIDGAGRPSGSYPVEAPEGDLRPDLIARGHFRFMPTSGNIFSVPRIAPGFPLPEARWRISADAVLLRVAALAGPIRTLPFALGSYRAHGGNSYHRAAAPEMRFLRRAMRDMADATLAVADLPGDALFGPDPDLLRLQLILAFLRLRLQLPDHGANADSASIRAARQHIARLRLGPRIRMTCGLALGLLPLTLRLAPATRRWVRVQDRRPRWLDAALALALGPVIQARRRALHRPRWVAPILPGHRETRSGHAAAAVCNGFDWRDLDSAGRRLLCHPSGEILVALPHMAHGARLGFDLAATEALRGTPIAVALEHGDEVLARGEIIGQGRISMILEGSETLGEAPIRLRLWARGRAGLRTPAALLEITGLSVDPLPPPQPRILLGTGEVRRFAEIAPACQLAPPFDPATAAQPIATGRLLLGLVRPVRQAPCELVLRFGPAQIAGSLVASCGDGPLHRGRIGPGAEARIPLSARRNREDRDFDLALDLDPLDPFDEPAFDLQSLGIVGAPAEPLLVPGAIRTFTADPDPILGEGWIADETGALLFDMLGTLAFAIGPSAADDAQLHLRLAPAEPLPSGAALAVAVSAGETVLARIRLLGEHEFAVPLALANGNRHVALSLHVALLIAEDGAFTPRRGALRLRSLRLVSPVPTVPARPLLPPGPPRSLAAEIAAAAGIAEDAPDAAALRAARERLCAGLRALAPGAVRSEILTDETLDRLLGLARACDEADPERPGAANFDALFASDPAEAGRALALAILSAPPWVSTAGHEIGMLHEALRAFPAALAGYLCSISAPPRTEAGLAGYRSHVLRLYDFARAAFLADPPGGRNHRLAEEILHRLHPHPLLFGAGPLRDLGLARGRAIEAWLVGRGNRITLPRRPLTTLPGRLRLGVLLRSLGAIPETWILRGTLGGIDPGTFETVLFLAEATDGNPVPGPEGMRIVQLDGVGIDDAVETIRAAELDLFVLGTFFLGHDKVAAIAAHRLAPVQIATTAVSPMTTGMRSFDIMLSSHGCEPPDAAEHYSEQLHLADWPVQRFDFGAANPAPQEHRRLARARLGLPPDGVILTSGAALGKIGDGLLACWLDLLAAVPDAVLVLYPFAPNWRTSYARRGFERRLDAASAACGIDRARLVLLDSLEPAMVRRLLALSDVYLDSFPYAGATTVVEALAAGLPAVALAGDSQRGLQGAAWLTTAGLGDLVAATPAAYVATAARLAGSAEARATARAAIRLPATPDPASGRQFGALLLDLAGATPVPLPRYLFHHMPKAGGTSCRRVFADWFEVRDDDRPPWSIAPAPPPLTRLTPGQLVCGHFNSAGYLLRERYPEILGDPGWRLITFLRDPLETALSYYFFERTHRPEADPSFRPLDLDTYLAETPGHLAEHLASIADDWRIALDRYWFVGTLDRLDEGLRWLAAALGKPLPETIARLNHAPRTEPPSDAAIDAFVQRHAEEFVIYHAAAARAAAILATDPWSAR